MERALIRLHAAVFVIGPAASVGDLVALLTRVPCPQLGTSPPPASSTALTATATAAAEDDKQKQVGAFGFCHVAMSETEECGAFGTKTLTTTCELDSADCCSSGGG
jgi:hypothetical protein